MAPLLYYLLLKPLSLLPMRALLVFSDLLYLILYRVMGYRTAVVRSNLKGSFPDVSDGELRVLERKFYVHLCDLLVESIRLFSYSKAEAEERYQLKNPEIFEPYRNHPKGVVLVSSHMNNWEWACTGLPGQLPLPIVGVYLQLSNPWFERKMREARGRYGMVLVHTKLAQGFFNESTQPHIYLLAIDQSPTFARQVYWTEFLNRETAVPIGAERFARAADMPVFYINKHKVARGRYEVWVEPLFQPPLANVPEGAILEAGTRKIAEEIAREAEHWLWTHKRWKRQRKPGEELFQITKG
jgi:KDO2-lipid IV(A) lauroyltransferase